MAKKKHEHHGGAWKVAYADFVTSMMALFLVLSDCQLQTRDLVYTSLYFKDPTNKNWPTTWGIMEKEIKATQKDARSTTREISKTKGSCAPSLAISTGS
jgi:flagellar motor protein MotB